MVKSALKDEEQGQKSFALMYSGAASILETGPASKMEPMSFRRAAPAIDSTNWA
jgi:hypothetical protein